MCACTPAGHGVGLSVHVSRCEHVCACTHLRVHTTVHLCISEGMSASTHPLEYRREHGEFGQQRACVQVGMNIHVLICMQVCLSVGGHTGVVCLLHVHVHMHVLGSTI